MATAAAGAPVGRDSVTYTVSGGPFTAGTFGAASIDILMRSNIVVGGGGSGQGQGKPTFDNVRLYKPIDASSVAFFRAIASGTAATVIELKLYKTGAATPFYSIKLTNPRVMDYGFVYNSNPFIEQISLVVLYPTIFQSFGIHDLKALQRPFRGI